MVVRSGRLTQMKSNILRGVSAFSPCLGWDKEEENPTKPQQWPTQICIFFDNPWNTLDVNGWSGVQLALLWPADSLYRRPTKTAFPKNCDFLPPRAITRVSFGSFDRNLVAKQERSLEEAMCLKLPATVKEGFTIEVRRKMKCSVIDVCRVRFEKAFPKKNPLREPVSSLKGYTVDLNITKQAYWISGVSCSTGISILSHSSSMPSGASLPSMPCGRTIPGLINRFKF